MAETFRLADGYVPFDKQLDFHQSRARFVVVAAGNRGGKTKSGAVEFLIRIFRDIADPAKGKSSAGRGNDRPARLCYWVVSATYKLLRFAYEEIVRMLPRELIESINQSTRTIWIKGNVRIDFVSADNPQHLVGASLNGLWVDEACLVKEGAWEQNLRARLADQQGFAIFTSTPEHGRANWLYQQLVSRAGTDPYIGSFTWTTEENPYVPRAEIEHARATMDPAWYARKWCASWDSFGGAIYPAFDDAIHVTTEERLRVELGIRRPWKEVFAEHGNRAIAAIDFGHGAPGCMLTVGEIGDVAWVVLDEFYSVGIRPLVGSTRTWFGECQRVMRDYGVKEFVGDYGGGGDGHMQDLRNNGIPVRNAHKTVQAGISRVAGALHVNPITKRPRLRILNTARNLIRELRVYQWKQAPNGTDFLDEPAPGQDDHAADSLRYAAMALRTYDYVEQQRSLAPARPIF